MIEKRLTGLSPELWQAIDEARGDAPRSPFIERLLWQSRAVKKAAADNKIEKPDRPADGRGRKKGGGDRGKK